MSREQFQGWDMLGLGLGAFVLGVLIGAILL